MHRPKPSFDGSIPSGNAAAALGLLRLYHYVGDTRFLEAAERTLRCFSGAMQAQPFGFAHMLAAADLYLRKPREIVVVGRADDPARAALLAQVHRELLPDKTVVAVEPDARERLPIAEGKTQVGGRTTVYVCHAYTCSPPATEWSELAPLLRA